MNEREAFEQGIDSNPLDATNHLVYADWLDEHGEPDEAAFRRAMGNWMQWHAGNNKKNGTTFPYMPKWNERRPWTAIYHLEGPHQGVPRGVDSGSIQIWFHPRHYDGGEPVEYGSLEPPESWIGEAGPSRSIHWKSYRDMEDAFRRNFMENRSSQQSQQMSRIARARARRV